MIKRLRMSGVGATGIYLVSNTVSAAVPFFLLPILVRLLSTEEYGQVALFTALVNVALTLVGVNTLGSVKRRFFSGGEEDREADYAAFVGTVLLILLVTAGLAVLAVLALAGWLQSLTGFSLIVLLFAVLAAAFKFLIDLRLGDLQVRREALRYGVLQSAYAVANGLVSIVLVWFVWREAEGRIYGVVISSGLFALIAIIGLSRLGRLTWAVTRERLKDALAFGIPLVPHATGVFLLASVDRFFVAEYSGLAAAGIYAAAMQVTFAIRLVTESINKSFQPWVFEQLSTGEAQARDRLVANFYKVALLTAIGSFLFAVLAPVIVPAVLGPRYEQAIALIPVLALGTAFHGIYIYLMNLILYTGRTVHLSYVTIFIGIGTVGLLVVLVPLHGPIGAAWAFAIGSLLRMLSVLIISAWVSPLPWRFPNPSWLLGRGA